jgi:hypothetical protein
MPVLLRQYRETDIATQKKAVLDVLLEILDASKQLYGETSETADTRRSSNFMVFLKNMYADIRIFRRQ